MQKRKVFLGTSLLTCSVLFSQTALAVTTPDQRTLGGSAPAAQVNQTRAYLEEQALRKRLEQEQQQQRSQVEAPAIVSEQKPKVESVFTLADINFSPSQVFTEKELEQLKAPYLHKSIDVDLLYYLINKINELYKEKGYVVCRAYLPVQTISEGVARITLVEGKTGNIDVVNNNSTSKRYITSRINLKKGKVSNLNDLNKSLLWFNGTNDVQLRIRLKAGTEPGTTDYELTALEPKRSQFYALVDTAGNSSTGVLREGLGWFSRSLTGSRDTLMLSGLHSKGTNSGSVSYSIPISNSGTKLNLQYQHNKVKIKSGNLADLDVDGNSTYYGVGISQPLAITQKTRVFAGLDWYHQTSKTDFMSNPWIDDKINRIAANINFTHYGDNVVWYHRHSFSQGKWDNLEGTSKNYFIYNLNFLRQQMFKSKKIFTVKLNTQYANKGYIASADQFYIGGINTVRGYKESVLSGDSGVNLSLEMSVPDRTNSEWIYFADYGSVFGDSAFDDKALYSVGAGYRYRLGNWLTANLMLGIPFKTELNGTEHGHYRLHFSLNAYF